MLIEETIELDTRRERIVFTPFTAADRRSVFDVDPEQVTIQTTDGNLVERRVDPRVSFAGYDSATPWDAVQVAYFISYSMWNYLTEPFLFTYPGVQAHEIAPRQEEEQGETWRRLRVTFPPTIAIHNPKQVFYYDAGGMQRRMDYAPDEVNGNSPVAHYTSEPKAFGGLVFPTRRRVYRRNPDGTADVRVAAITIDIHDIALR